MYMGHWIFFSTGLEYNISYQYDSDIRDFDGEYLKFIEIDDKVFDFYNSHHGQEYENKFNVTDCFCCMEENVEKLLYIMPCFHGMCGKCFYKVKQKSNKCPMCRADFVVKPIENEMKKYFITDFVIGEPFYFTEEEYDLMKTNNSSLVHYTQSCIKWYSHDKEDVKRQILSIKNIDIDSILEDYDENINGTKLLYKSLVISTEEDDEIKYKIYLGLLIYHQLLYSDELIASCNV